jgi:hypothetical protein
VTGNTYGNEVYKHQENNSKNNEGNILGKQNLKAQSTNKLYYYKNNKILKNQ